MGIVQSIARQQLPAALRPRENELLEFTGTLFEHAIPELLLRYQDSAATTAGTTVNTPASIGTSTTNLTTATTGGVARARAGAGRFAQEQTPPTDVSSVGTGTTILSPPGPGTTENSASPRSTNLDWQNNTGAFASMMGGNVMTDGELAAWAQQQSPFDDDPQPEQAFDGYLQQFGWDLNTQMPLEDGFTREEADPVLDGYSEGGTYSTWAYDQHGYQVNPLASRHAT